MVSTDDAQVDGRVDLQEPEAQIQQGPARYTGLATKIYRLVFVTIFCVLLTFCN